MRIWFREHSLGIITSALFVIFLLGMALVGVNNYNEDQLQHGGTAVSFAGYLTTPNFFEAVFENWESEFLQMGMLIVLTIFLFQKGSAESKPIDEPSEQDEDPRNAADKPGAPWPVRHGGWVLVAYENSQLILFFGLFLMSFVLHAISGAGEYSQEQLDHGGAAVSALEYVGTSQFWFESFQNWQSEFLVVAVMVIATAFLRQRGSAESKPVAAPNAETGGH